MTPLKNKIPTARQILKNALEYDMPSEVRIAIQQAIQLMYREKYKPIKARATSKRMTAHLRDTIKIYYSQNPSLSTQHIADHFGVNQGRVSEILAGDYDKLGS